MKSAIQSEWMKEWKESKTTETKHLAVSHTMTKREIEASREKSNQRTFEKPVAPGLPQ